MELLIKSATLIAPSSKFHNQEVDLLIKNGKIDQIGEKLSSKTTKVIDIAGLHVSKGWVDLHANIQDPGYEFKEDIETAISAAAAGGFTTIAVSPLSEPIRDSKAQIEYLIKSSKNKVVSVLPYGSISKNAEGKELAELNDMYNSGAIAFFDGKRPVSNPNLINRALMYTKAFDGTVINFPHTKEVAYNGVMNEGITSTQLGLKGIPELAESLMVSRDLSLVEYTNGKLHFNTISSSKSLEMIAKAKKNKLNVSCDVAAYNLLLDEEKLEDFDSRFKTLPPLRDKKTINALIKGIKDGVVDAICSDHQPEDIESKKKEFDHAAFGIINLQTAFASAHTALSKKVELTKIINLFTEGPAKVLGISLPSIQEGEKANLTLFLPNDEFVLTKDLVKSKSNNSPFFGMSLKGKVYGVINNGKFVGN